MNLSEYAQKYRGAIGAILREVASVRGSHSVRHAYVREARNLLAAAGVESEDAYEIAELLTAEQMRRLGERLDEFTDGGGVDELL